MASLSANQKPKKFSEILKENEGKIQQPVKKPAEDEALKEIEDSNLLALKKNFHSNKLFYRVMQENPLTEVVDQEFEYYLGDQLLDAKMEFERMMYDLYHLKPKRELAGCVERRESTYDLSQIAKYHSNHYYDLKGYVIRNRYHYGITK
jgi:hypothetical protein